MSARFHAPSPAGQRGIALLTTILMMVLMSALLVGFTTAVMSDQSYRAIDRDRARAFYGAQSGIEKQNADLAKLFMNQVGPSDAQITALGVAANRPAIPNVAFVDTGTSPAYQISILGGATNGIISSGPYEGLMALKRQFQLDATARAVDGGEVHLKRVVETVAIPVFQFGIFSDVDLAFNAADDFDFGGRVHTNRNLYLAEGNGSKLVLRAKVTAVGEVIRQFLPNGVSIASAGQTGTVDMTRGNTKGPFRAMATNEGSVTGGPLSALNNSWPNVSLSTYVGNIRNGRTGVSPLDLDLVAANGANIDLIRRPPTTEATSSPVYAERYFKKVSVRILLSDTINDITAMPTVSTAAPVPLEGNWMTAAPAGYVVGLNRPALARSAGQYPNLPVNSLTATISANVDENSSNNATIPMNPLPDYFRMPTLSMTVAGIPYVVTCTGKTASTLIGCARVPATGTVSIPTGTVVSGLSRTVDARAVSMPLRSSSWPASTTQTLTAEAGSNTFPTAPLSVNSFFVRGKHILVTCTGYDTTPRFTGCNVPSDISSGEQIETGYLSSAGTSTIGGFLKVEIQTSDNVWRDVTLEWLNYGFSAPNEFGPLCDDPTPNAIIRLQRLRDNNEPDGLATCTYNNSTASADHWPNVLFDVREALSRDAAPASHNGRVLLGGTMHYVELDAANLSRWFTRQGGYAAGTGNLAMREGGAATSGFSVYFSDRRNNHNVTNQETGDYGWEDTINPGSSTGAPDGVLNEGEDVNANGTLDTYGQFPNYLGLYNTAPPGAIAPLTTAARPLTLLSGGQAKVNRAVIFRRALKVSNGDLGTLVAPGLTIASENPVYLEGNWNANGGWSGASVATSIAADTVVALSDEWKDFNSFGPYSSKAAINLNPYNSDGRPRSSSTHYRVALISGKGTIFPAGSVGGTYGTDGGAHNFIRFLEGGSDKVSYMGSMVTFFYTRQNLMPHKCCGGIVYGVPDRNYSFDVNFLDPARLPPLTPAFRDLNALGFSQETRPGK